MRHAVSIENLCRLHPPLTAPCHTDTGGNQIQMKMNIEPLAYFKIFSIRRLYIYVYVLVFELVHCLPP